MPSTYDHRFIADMYVVITEPLGECSLVAELNIAGLLQGVRQIGVTNLHHACLISLHMSTPRHIRNTQVQRPRPSSYKQRTVASVDVYQFNQFRLNFKRSAESLGFSGTIVSFGNCSHGPCENFGILKPITLVCGFVHYLLYYTILGLVGILISISISILYFVSGSIDLYTEAVLCFLC